MRARTTRVFVLSVVLVSSFALTAAPQREPGERGGIREEPRIVKIIKRLKGAIVSLGDTLTIPIP